LPKAGCELEFEDTFDGGVLDERRWIPHSLSQWSSRERSAARYRIGDGSLRLLIEADQQSWCPEYDGAVRVSSLQTGMFAGPVGSTIGQQRFNPDAVEPQPTRLSRVRRAATSERVTRSDRDRRRRRRPLSRPPGDEALAIATLIWVLLHAYELVWWREARAETRARRLTANS
jgi:hypothetical protein